jgi:hypothetical protein
MSMPTCIRNQNAALSVGRWGEGNKTSCTRLTRYVQTRARVRRRDDHSPWPLLGLYRSALLLVTIHQGYRGVVMPLR